MPTGYFKGQIVNNSESTLNRLLLLYRNSTLSDIQLVVDGFIFSAHKLILSMCSDVFKTMLTDMKWPEAYKDQITLTEEPECVGVFGDFIEYLYTGHIHLSNTSVLPVLTLGDKYNVKDLSEICITFMFSNIDAVGENLQVVSWLQYARLCNYHALESACLRYIEWNFLKVVQGSDFLSMNESTLLEFLSKSDLVVTSEFNLFLHVKRWIIFNHASTELCPVMWRKFVVKIGNCIRFNMMTSSQLHLLCQDPFINEYADIFEDYLMQAFQCRSVRKHELNGNNHGISDMQLSDSSSPTNVSDSKKIPRNYTCEDWSCDLVLENFSDLEDFTTRTFFFSTPTSSSLMDEHNHDNCWDWQVDLYPKGVLFPRAILIGLEENFEIDQHKHFITRLGVKVNSVLDGVRNVEVAILAKARGANGSEYVRNMIKKKCMFDFDGCLYNLDNIVPYQEFQEQGTPYLTEDGNTFKILVVIKPLPGG